MRAIVLCLLVSISLTSSQAQDWSSKSIPNDLKAVTLASFDTLKHQIEQALNHQVPELQYRDLFSGKRDSLSSLRGKVVMVYVWNIHCAPCVAELPGLYVIQNQLRKSGFLLLTISLDDSASQRSFLSNRQLRRTGITAQTRFEEFSYPFTFRFTPSAYIIDRNGIFRNFLVGAQTHDQLTRAIVPYL